MTTDKTKKKDRLSQAEKDQTPDTEASGTSPVAKGSESASKPESNSPEQEAFVKSAKEIAAEEAMLAELEKNHVNVREISEENVVNILHHDEDKLADQTAAPRNLDLLQEVDLLITVELGRKEMRFGDVLKLNQGSLVELNKLADEPVDIYVNQSKIAEGEVVVVDDHFGVRITKLMAAGTSKGS